MKCVNKIICFIAIILLLSGCIQKKVDIKDTKYFSYSYSVGNYMNGSIAYKIELNEDGKYIASFKDDGIDEDDKLVKEIDEHTVLELEKILKNNNIDKWNGFNKVDKLVLDGYSFDLYYRTESDETIEASGYMKYPTGYSNFKSDIANFFNKIFEDELNKENG